ncbi:MAG: dynamin family protein, partial [Acidobacteriota bacterium]|nr:dynamin family protein [Acidobacteriota bacterium]
EQRALFDVSRALLSDLDMLPADIEALEAMRRRLDELFLIVVVGEYNAGKSTFLNAILSADTLETGELPTTRQVHLLRYGPVQSVREGEPGLLIHEIPVDLLQDLNIVDTPGTNSMQREEQELTEGFVPRADFVFFVTSLVRPYSASEHDFLKLILSWGKHIVFIVNQVDFATGPDHVERVKRYVEQQAIEDLGEKRPLFAVSAREVVQERTEGFALGELNEWPAFSEYFQTTLQERGRVRLKLAAPLQSLKPVLARQHNALGERARLVHGDHAALEAILDEVDGYETRMLDDVSRYQAQITNVLWQLERRGNRFFDELVRMSNITRLRDNDIVENRFRNEVVADTPLRIEEEVQALIDWLVRQNLTMWEKADTMLQQRREALREAAGRPRFISPQYVYNREEIFTKLAQPVRRRLALFDARREAEEIVAAVNAAIAKTFGVQALVIGVGAVLTAAFTSLGIDVTGTVGATLLAAAGLFILPQRRARLKRELSSKVEVLRVELAQTLEMRFQEQLRDYVEQLRDTFRPELESTASHALRLREANQTLESYQAECARLFSKIEAPNGEHQHAADR